MGEACRRPSLHFHCVSPAGWLVAVLDCCLPLYCILSLSCGGGLCCLSRLGSHSPPLDIHSSALLDFAGPVECVVAGDGECGEVSTVIRTSSGIVNDVSSANGTITPMLQQGSDSATHVITRSAGPAHHRERKGGEDREGRRTRKKSAENHRQPMTPRRGVMRWCCCV
jgi:hypothetical protein